MQEMRLSIKKILFLMDISEWAKMNLMEHIRSITHVSLIDCSRLNSEWNLLHPGGT